MGTPTHQHSFVRVIVHIVVTGYLNGQALFKSRRYSVSNVSGEYSEWPVTKNSRPPRAPPYIHQHPPTRKAASIPEPSVYLPGALPCGGYAAHRTYHQIHGKWDATVARYDVQRYRTSSYPVHTSALHNDDRACLRRPADVERRGDMRTRPVEDFSNLIPISHLLKIHLLYRSTGDNHAIVLFTAHLVEIRIECFHVFYSECSWKYGFLSS